jgi:hypothetical protein
MEKCPPGNTLPSEEWKIGKRRLCVKYNHRHDAVGKEEGGDRFLKKSRKTKGTILLLDKEKWGCRGKEIADYLGADQPMLGHFELPKS